jgi:hypothetical protein
MRGAEVQSDNWGFRARLALFRAAQVDLQLVRSGVMDVIGTADPGSSRIARVRNRGPEVGLEDPGRSPAEPALAEVSIRTIMIGCTTLLIQLRQCCTCRVEVQYNRSAGLFQLLKLPRFPLALGRHFRTG